MTDIRLGKYRYFKQTSQKTIIKRYLVAGAGNTGPSCFTKKNTKSIEKNLMRVKVLLNFNSKIL